MTSSKFPLFSNKIFYVCMSDKQSEEEEYVDSCSSDHSRNPLDEEFERVMAKYPNPDLSFYKEYCRLYLNNVRLVQQVHSSETVDQGSTGSQ